jgi:uncharacterized protein
VSLRTLLACVALVALAPGCKGAGSDASGQNQALQIIDLSIKTKDKKTYAFKVEVAATPEEQARGLMFRESLPPFGGMLFPMNPPRPAGFWMKNTVISLDMIFIRKNGQIARIAAETVPYSLDEVTSGEPVAAVLELSGGRAAQLGIKEGDTVSW